MIGADQTAPTGAVFLCARVENDSHSQVAGSRDLLRMILIISSQLRMIFIIAPRIENDSHYRRVAAY